MPDRQNRDSLSSYSIENDVRRSPDDQFAQSWFNTRASHVGKVLQHFDNRYDSHAKSRRSIPLVLRNVSTNLIQTLTRSGGPDNV